MNGDRRLSDLVERYLQGTLDASARDELHGLLTSDPAARSFFSEQLAMGNLLGELYQARDFTPDTVDRILAGKSLPAPKEDSKQISTRHLRKLRRSRTHAGRPNIWIPLLVAASLLVAFSILFLTASSTPAPQRSAPQNTAAHPRPRVPKAPPPAPAPPRPPVRTEQVRQAEAELAHIRQEEERVRQELKDADRRKQDDLKKKAEEMMAAIRKEQAAAEERLRRAKAAGKKPGPKPPAPSPTASAVASVEPLTGTVHVLRGDGTAVLGAVVREKGGVRTGPASTAAIVFSDGTRLELGSDSEIRDVVSSAKEKRAGKWVTLSRGSLRAQVAKQPFGSPMKFGAGHGEATVLGTTLTLGLEEAALRLEVAEGRVRLRRASDGKSVDVRAGHFAVAGTDIKLVSRPITGVALFADDFNRSALDQWPQAWLHHSNTGRSGFRVLADPAAPGNRYIGIPTPAAASTQHAFLPVSEWRRDFDLSFRMRVTGPKSTRAGFELEDGVQIPAFEYDHRANVLRASWPRAPQARVRIPDGSTEVPLSLAQGRWVEWRVEVRGRRVTVRVNGTELSTEIPQLGTVRRSSLISQGADGVHFDDVRLTERGSR